MPEVEEFDEKTTAVFHRKGYKILQSLSAGSFGQVYKAINPETNELFAVKVMNLEKCKQAFKEKFLPREMAVMIEVNHQNIIQLFDIFIANKRLFIFMEFASGGDIAGYLKKHGPMKEPKAYYWFRQVCDGLNYLHTEAHIAHRDIKIDNILLDDKYTAKLTDFGFAKESLDDNGKVILSETYCGTEPYYSPQIVKRQKYNPFMADCWAMGVVLFAMLNNKFPFHFGPKHGGATGMLKEQLNPEFLTTRYIQDFSKHVKHLLKRLFEPGEESRLTMTEALRHKWVIEKGNCQCK